MGVNGDKRLSELPQAAQAAQTDLMYITASGEPRSISRADLLKVVDNLVSNSQVNPLSANQGAVLAAMIAAAGIKQGTWTDIQAVAAAAPTKPFTAAVQMPDGTIHGMMYLGDATAGFIDLGSGGSSASQQEVG